ncbi:DUF6105 family protein [Mesorhizobium sp. CAU 1732]|uniref:DUF6105 family protein n=1 Tax=Mesorhizobium sp. CAU 1732 TaxID=3140358 RepID=UPI00325FF7AD
MRYILLFWALPMGFFWGWYLLSYHDMSFGMPFLTRSVHDYAFGFYANILGIDPATIPPLVLRACIVDTGLIFAIFAFRKRREIAAWWRDRRFAMGGQTPFAVSEAGRVPPAE